MYTATSELYAHRPKRKYFFYLSMQVCLYTYQSHCPYLRLTKMFLDQLDSTLFVWSFLSEYIYNTIMSFWSMLSTYFLVIISLYILNHPNVTHFFTRVLVSLFCTMTWQCTSAFSLSFLSHHFLHFHTYYSHCITYLTWQSDLLSTLRAIE